MDSYYLCHYFISYSYVIFNIQKKEKMDFKGFIIPIMTVLLIFCVHGIEVEETICEETYYFIIDNLQEGNIFEYDNSTIDELKQILLENYNISNITPEDYLANYTQKCYNITPDLLLPKFIKELGYIFSPLLI